MFSMFVLRTTCFLIIILWSKPLNRNISPFLGHILPWTHLCGSSIMDSTPLFGHLVDLISDIFCSDLMLL